MDLQMPSIPNYHITPFICFTLYAYARRVSLAGLFPAIQMCSVAIHVQRTKCFCTMRFIFLQALAIKGSHHCRAGKGTRRIHCITSLRLAGTSMSSKQSRPHQEPDRMSPVDLQSHDSRAPSPVPAPVDIERSPSQPNSEPAGWVYQALCIVSFSQIILMVGLAR